MQGCKQTGHKSAHISQLLLRIRLCWVV